MTLSLVKPRFEASLCYKTQWVVSCTQSNPAHQVVARINKTHYTTHISGPPLPSSFTLCHPSPFSMVVLRNWPIPVTGTRPNGQSVWPNADSRFQLEAKNGGNILVNLVKHPWTWMEINWHKGSIISDCRCFSWGGGVVSRDLFSSIWQTNPCL